MRRNVVIVSGGLGVVAIVGLAYFLRYEPMPPQAGVWQQVWDRWHQRVCLTPRPEITDVNGIACSETEVDALKDRIVAEATTREERERPAREAREAKDRAAWKASQRASAEFLARQQAELEQEKKANVAAQEKAERLRQTIYTYVQLRDFLGAPDKWQINQMRTDGHSEDYIAEKVMPYRTKLLSAGAPKQVADEYFGGDPFLNPGVKP
jgi:hypothetical protein